MNDINALSGIEFEELCKILLQKVGFEVQSTKQSGDGGIDLIAYSHTPFFEGKYIVQCKRYSGSVGEPIIRDLYGVVMSEHANKGILITTGYFTMSAANFAFNKNIELIDGEKLANILSENGILASSNKQGKNHFTEYECFDKKKYNFMKNMISQNSFTDDMGRDYLLKFFFNYFINKTESDEENLNNMIHSGFSEEYIRLFDWYLKKYYNRGKDNKRLAELLSNKHKSIALLYNLDIFEYVKSKYKYFQSNMVYSIKCTYEDRYDRFGKPLERGFYLGHEWNDPKSAETKVYILENQNNDLLVTVKKSYVFYELMSLLAIFNYFQISKGIEYINNLLFGEYPEFKNLIVAQKEYKNAIDKVNIYYSNDIWGEPFERYYEYIDMTSYFDIFTQKDREKIGKEVEKIEEMLDGL